MLLALVFILLLIGAAVVGSLYSNFIVFYKSFAEIDSYNKAYYASIAALERGELVIKQREPGYVGSGGRKGTENINLDAANNDTDGIDSDFSYLIKSEDTNLLRDINSRTNRVPRQGEGDIDRMLATGDSLNYNKMDYENTEVFLLYVDKSIDSPYLKKSCLNPGNCDNIQVEIQGQIRLPPKIREVFRDLDITDSLVIGGSKDDEIVDWQLKGRYLGEQFTIFAKNKTVFGNDSSDSVIKESDINGTVNLKFGDNSKKRQPNEAGKISELVVISPNDMENSYKDKNFSDILNPSGTNNFSGLNLKLSLLNLLKTEQKMIYPYLEYYLSFGNKDVADKYFKIDAEGRYKDYQVNIIMHKPTVKESVLGNFTVIF